MDWCKRKTTDNDDTYSEDQLYYLIKFCDMHCSTVQYMEVTDDSKL